jgi:GntR family transcriptional regulator / MocR family aminotransferase
VLGVAERTDFQPIQPMGNQPAANPLIPIDPRARGALQKQIYAGIRRAILEGALRPGTRLMSSRALAADLGVSRITTLLALEQLQAEGYVTSRRGSGMFVAHELPDDLPQLPTPIGKALMTHPPLSRRGAELAATPPASRRLPGPPRAFRLGAPAVDLFPRRVWSQIAQRCLKSLPASALDYGDPAGLPALREAISAHVGAVRGTRCDADQVFIVAGAAQGLGLLCRLLLDPGDDVWLEDPGYSGAHSAALGAGARIHPVRVDEEGLDVAAGARSAPAARLVFVTPSHQFPLGVTMSLPRRLALLRWASSARAWVIEDDYDSEFRYSTHPIPCLHGLDAGERVIYLDSFSKNLFPALRLGFVIVPKDLRHQLYTARRAAEMHPPIVDQTVLAEFMQTGHFERHIRRMRAVYRERLEALAAAAERWCGDALRLRPVRTGLHAVADLGEADDETVWREAAARGVEVTPLSSYYAGDAPRINGLVMGFSAVAPEALDLGMQQLAAAIEAASRPRTRRQAE